MPVQGLHALAGQIKDSIASIRSGFALGCAYDNGSVTLEEVRASLTGTERQMDRVLAGTGSTDRPEFSVA
jgi:hypothetical protein